LIRFNFLGHPSVSLERPASSDSVPSIAPWLNEERRSVVKMKLTIAKVLFAIAAILFILSLLSVKVSDFNLVTAGLAFVAAGLFFEGYM
jgi:hypothetical protein